MSGSPVHVVGFGIAGVEEDLRESAAEGAPALVGLYLPPWEAFLARADTDGVPTGTDHDWAVDWLAWHRALLALYEAAPERVYLVNVGRLESQELLYGHLGEAGLAVPEGLEAVTLSQADAPVARLLAAVMAEFARPLWEQYQALEACAALFGREPEFLANACLPDLARSEAVLLALREVQAEARKAGNAASAHEAAAAARLAERDAALVAELRQENELLALQLQQLHEELHFQVESGKQMRQALAEAETVATSARLLISSLATSDNPG